MSSMTESVISKIFERPVQWDHRIKDYCNRDFVDAAFVFGLNTNSCIEMQNKVNVIASVITTLNDCTSPVASTCHGTESAGLWKNSRNRFRACLAEAVTEL
jgi:hypothetical protein